MHKKSYRTHKYTNKSLFIEGRGIFHQEAQYFNKLLPLLRESFVGEDWCPKSFLASDKAALRAQARLHAVSLLAQAKLGKSPAELYPEACVEQIYNDFMQQSKLILLFVDLAVRDPPHERDYQSKLSPVVSHGDCWPNNYLFDKSQPPRASIVDFQMARYAPRMYDITHLIYLSTTSSIRKRELSKAIEAYHEELCDALEKNHPQLERPSLEELLEVYEDMKLSALFTGIMFYPIIFLSKKEMMKYKDEPILFLAISNVEHLN
ncbi:uncharacterized protein LOC103316028 [Nasonia vitripennis]|uniref:CHK kinase-like domain-containing protein n=1 Tax=Nasonia vitripennis TaxID=7425 RepID=A0A7M7H356_NASVI|nr:uncharacterized protein LOC103316028 [Nasonia vitripennis]